MKNREEYAIVDTETRIPIKSNSEEIKQSKLNHCDQQWETRFFELREFKKLRGHCDVPRNYKNKQYRVLAYWCNTQRKEKKFNPLKYSPDREKKLNELGFSWGLRDKRFEYKFQQLKQYSEKYGHCNVRLNENRTLANWCYSLRVDRKRKAKELTKARILRLTELGFEWYDIKKNELRWEEQFVKLKEFKKKYGHCNVSRIHSTYRSEYILSQWIIKQRAYYRNKNKLLTAKRIAKLNSIGFNWINPIKMGDARRISNEDLFNELRRLYILHGKQPGVTYIDKYGKYSRKPYYTRFGSIDKACEKAGIDSGVSK